MTSWMDWNGIMLSEIIQTKKYCMVSHVESQKKKKKEEETNSEQTGGCKVGGRWKG